MNYPVLMGPILYRGPIVVPEEPRIRIGSCYPNNATLASKKTQPTLTHSLN